MKAKRILIYLHPTPSTQVSWIILDENNQKLDAVYNGDLQTFPTETADYHSFVFVPTEHILLTHVELPKLSYSKLMQALPFALEEQLIQDVEELHFATGDYQSDGTWPVAVISKSKMQSWLTLCQEMNIAPRAFIPSIFLVPFVEGTWQINTDQEHCLVRTEHYAGFGCEKSNVNILIDFKLTEKIDTATPQFVNTHETEFHLLEKMAQQPTLPDHINLLQGAYQPKLQTTQTKKIWALTGYLALALIALGFFSQFVSYFILHREAANIELAINTIYKKHFPNAKSIVAPRERMNEKLHQVTGISNKQNLLILLGQIGKALSGNKNIKILHLEFREQQLTLEVSTQEFAALDRFTQSLSQQNLSVKQQNAATVGNEVKATLIIRPSTG